MQHFLHSVRWRLQLWHALILMGVITLLCVLAYRLAADNRREKIDSDLSTFERVFMRQLWDISNRRKIPDKPFSPEQIQLILQKRSDTDLPLEMRDLFDPNATESAYIAFWDGSGKQVYQSANAPKNLSWPKSPPSNKDFATRMNGSRREVIRNGPRGFRSVVGRDISTDNSELRNLAWQIALSGAAIWLLGLVGGWWLAGRVIRPVNLISQTAIRIAGGNVSERIDIARTDDELSRLSHVLNGTFDRLESAIQRQRQFTADASHELRTPLTVILSETGRGLKRDRSPEEYREILSTCSHAATRMRSLVESLLILARQDNEQPLPHREICDLKQIIMEASQLLRPLAEDKHTPILLDLEEVSCHGDPRALSMVAINLMANALDHQPPNGNVWVRLAKEREGIILEVKDSGPGIAPLHLPHLFDRFYRVDPARQAAGGHSGLGLAIVKAVITNHGGTIAVTSEPGCGTTFRMVLPTQKLP